jgi:hypothetical protein
MPGDQWNGLAARIDQCRALDKPIFVGETGIVPDDVGGTLGARADAFDAKFRAQLGAGVAGELVWAWSAFGSLLDNYDVGPGDPTLGVLAAHSLTPRYPRPKAATPVQIPLVPAYTPCGSGNRTHGAPLSFASCAPPDQSSGQLTVGTADSNGKAANSTGHVTLAVIPGNPSTPADEADVRVATSISDVRNRSDLFDYTGQVQTALNVRLTKRQPTANGDESQTTEDFPFAINVPCAATMLTTVGSTCALTTTADTVLPGAIPESKRSIWALDKVKVYDAGPDGDVATAGDNALFETQGVFVP